MNPSNTGIYTIESPTNKIYVGQSVDLKNRERQYKNGQTCRQPLLHRSIKKYGWEAHQFLIIMPLKDDLNQGQLDYWEQFFINFYRDIGIILLNIREAGSRGRHSEESKLKIGLANSISLKGKKLTDEHKENIRLGNLGKTITEESREKMRIAQQNVKHGPLSEEHKLNIGLAHKGSKRSDETKQRMSVAQKGRTHGPMADDHKEKLRTASSKHKHSEESKEKMRQSWIIRKENKLKNEKL